MGLRHGTISAQGSAARWQSRCIFHLGSARCLYNSWLLLSVGFGCEILGSSQAAGREKHPDFSVSVLAPAEPSCLPAISTLEVGRGWWHGWGAREQRLHGGRGRSSSAGLILPCSAPGWQMVLCPPRKGSGEIKCWQPRGGGIASPSYAPAG